MKYVFVASSSKSVGISQGVCRSLKKVRNVAPLHWKECFPAGRMALASIEETMRRVAGAVLVATPAIKKGARTFWPNYNVIFEFGLFSARLGHENVAVLLFDGVELPTDLAGYTYIKAGKMPKDGESFRLSGTAFDALEHWCERLHDTPNGLPRTSLNHGYSGHWSIEAHHLKWRGIVIEQPSKAGFNGNMFLHIPFEGKRGAGFLDGIFMAKLKDRSQSTRTPYSAYITVKDPIDEVNCSEDGELSFLSHLTFRCFERPEIGKRSEWLNDQIGNETPDAKKYMFKMRIDPKSDCDLVGQMTSYPDADETIADVKLRKTDVALRRRVRGAA